MPSPNFNLQFRYFDFKLDISSTLNDILNVQHLTVFLDVPGTCHVSDARKRIRFRKENNESKNNE